MFFNYLSGRYNIPEKLFFEWTNDLDYLPIYKEIESNKYEEKDFSEVDFDDSLCEVLGILQGDGHISRFKYEVCIVGDLKEKEYYKYLKNLFEEKFRLKFVLREEKSTFKLRCYSKKLSLFLTKRFNLPIGKKVGNLKIPPEAKSSNEYLGSYIRGLFDTDGSFYIRRKKDPVLEITSADENFLKEIKNSLILLGFIPSKGDKRIFLYGEGQVDKFFKEIKPANYKHLKKYKNYLKSRRG